jgi:hypothetical protein
VKTKFYIIPTLLVWALATGCEKVIEMDLNTADKKFVVEANITDKAGTARVIISQTINFDEPNDFPPVTGAIVTVQEVGGPLYAFTESSPGNYTANSLTAVSGKTYTLTVNIGGANFSAASTMPSRINLDTIYVSDELIFTETRKIVNAVFNDPPGLGNSYRFIQYVNGVKEKQILIRNDDYSDGRTITNKLFYFSEDDEETRNIESGDQVIVDMQCIDPVIYKYWYSLDRSSTGGSGQATPSNPVTNLTGGALGYFSAHTLQTKIMVVP